MEFDWTAVFPRMAQAVEFAEFLRASGNYAVDVVQKGRTVVWNTAAWYVPDPEDGVNISFSYLESVGYYGSPPQGPVATLNGVKAPRSY